MLLLLKMPCGWASQEVLIGQVGRKEGEKSSAISMDENASGGFTEPKWELPSFSVCTLSERVSIGTNCTREDLLMQRQETGCVPTWTSQQTLFEVEVLCFSISSLLPSACFFLVLFFSTTAFVHYRKSFSSSRQPHQRPSGSSLEITHWL